MASFTGRDAKKLNKHPDQKLDVEVSFQLTHEASLTSPKTSPRNPTVTRKISGWRFPEFLSTESLDTKVIFLEVGNSTLIRLTSSPHINNAQYKQERARKAVNRLLISLSASSCPFVCFFVDLKVKNSFTRLTSVINHLLTRQNPYSISKRTANASVLHSIGICSRV